jgi:hypothetical protein
MWVCVARKTLCISDQKAYGELFVPLCRWKPNNLKSLGKGGLEAEDMPTLRIARTRGKLKEIMVYHVVL